jgi:RHS repeat-associated protein
MQRKPGDRRDVNRAQVNMTYHFSATQNNGRIVSSADAITGENVSYTYDSLNRLIAAATTNPTGPIWGNSYSYDGFGNLTGKTVTQGLALSASPQVNSATNQARMIGDYGFDANGNWLGMGSQSNAWNVENQLISNGTVDYGGNPITYTYDPWGKRVMQYSVGGVYGPTGTIYFYSITGQRLAIYTGQYPNELTQTSVNMYFGGRLLAPVDRLGSVRYNQNGPIAYFPWGEERTSTPDGTDKFGTYFRDATNNGIGEDYASARYYNNNFGRFWSPDLAGVKAARTKNPTSWNRYEYANDDPVNMFDPSGLGSGFTGSDPNDPTSGGSGPTTGCTTFADEGGVSTGGWTISSCWYTGIGSTDDPSPTGSCSAPSNYVFGAAGGGGGSCGGTGTAPPPKQPTCFIELKFRSLTTPGLEDYNHAYLWVQDENGTQWVLEGQPQNQNPLNWGNLVGYATQGTSGAPGYPQDHAQNDREQGEPLSGGQTICNLVDSAIALTQNYLQYMFGGDPIEYSPKVLNSNFFAHLLLKDLGIDIFGPPPSAPGW